MKLKDRETFLIGQKLRLLLKERGISQRRLAKMTGYTQQYINAIVNNKTSVSIKALKRIAEVLNVPISYFFEDETSEESINKELSVLFGDLTKLLQKLPPEKRRKAIQTFKEQLELMAV